MQASKIHSSIAAVDIKPLVMAAQDSADYQSLAQLGINLSASFIEQAASFAMDDQQGLVTQSSIVTPVQFLQTWLPGFVNTATAARKLDEIIGIVTVGAWEDEEVVQGILEPVGKAVTYGDYTNVPLSDLNTNFVRRNVVRREKGIRVGMLEEARAGRIRVSVAAEKRNAAVLSLEVERNLIGFYGVNNGNNLTYGFLNDPNLPAYQTVAASGTGGSTLWSSKDILGIAADIRIAAAQLQTQSQDLIDPSKTATTLVVSMAVAQYLSTPSIMGYSVRKYLADNYPLMRIVSAPQLTAANGGANVFYLFADKFEDGSSDGGATFIQVVPSKFMALGVEKQTKAYVESYSNATAGVMLKRPFAVVRYSGC